MPRRLALALLLAVSLPATAHAWAWGDTLTVIWKPLPNLPSFVRPGDTLTVWANAPASATVFAASLRLGALDFPLAPAGGAWQPSLGRWELGFRVPDGLAEEVYDLALSSDATAPDTARHAVKVLPAFRSDFYFAQVSDTHLPTHALSSGGVIDVTDTTAMADFDAVIADLNLIHPEFILHTGDIVNEGELEDYLGMFEMSRSCAMISRLRDPLFLVSGNHDQGGWKATAPPDGTARRNWWRQFGWPFLDSPPAGIHDHSQDYSFDYGLLHCIGLEAYINNGSYDSFRTAIYGAQSFTPEQLTWLSADLAAVPAGHAKLLYYHYDFGGTLAGGLPGPNFSQIDPVALGLDGAIWGHNHGVAEGAFGAHPFNLGLQAVVDGRRTFRIFRVHNGQLTPGPMHKSGGSSTIPTDSLTVAWSRANDGTASDLTASVLNRFTEAWDHARLVFEMADHDSTYLATGGSIAQVVHRGNGVASVYVDCVLAAAGGTTVSVRADQPANLAVGAPPAGALALAPPGPNPYRGDGPLTLAFTLAAEGPVDLALYDLAGRRVAGVLAGTAGPGAHGARWDGRMDGGAPARDGIYFVRLRAAGDERVRRVVVIH